MVNHPFVIVALSGGQSGVLRDAKFPRPGYSKKLMAEGTLDKLRVIVDDVPRNRLEDIQGDDIGTDRTIDVSRRQNHR